MSKVSRIVRAVERVARIYRREQGRVAVQRKADGTIVSSADTQGQELLVGELRTLFPGFRILGEEAELDIAASGREEGVIYVDPLDGTAAYCHGHNTYGISVGALDGTGGALFGVVAQPGLRRLYCAEKRRDGAFELRKNGLPLDPPRRVATALSDMYVFVSSDFHRVPRAVNLVGSFPGKIRALGVCTLQLTMLLEQAVSKDPAVVVVSRACSWDVVGALVILTASGMVLRDLGTGLPTTIAAAIAGRNIVPFFVGYAEDVDAVVRCSLPVARELPPTEEP